MSATQIRPDANRETFIAAINVADKLVEAAANTENRELTEVAFRARRQAWLALEEFDAGTATR